MAGNVVLVHGAWSSPADWRWVEDLLINAGVSVNALDLASHRFGDATRPTTWSSFVGRSRPRQGRSSRWAGHTVAR